MAETLPSPEPGSTVADLLLALDQGTQSSRCVLFDRSGRQLVARSVEFPQLRPRPGWCEHCPAALVASTLQAAAACLGAAEVAWGPAVSRRRGTDGLWTDGDNNKCRWRVACVGVANQRETCLAWDRASGEPLGPCVVWHDARPADDGTIDAARTALAREGVPDDAALRAATGLPLSPYFSGPKLAWLSEHCPRVRAAFESDAARVGTVDTLLAHWLTGGPERADAAHVTDLTNGARTLLLDLGAGPGGDGRPRWSPRLCRAFGVPPTALPRLVGTAERVGAVDPPDWVWTSASAPGVGPQLAPVKVAWRAWGAGLDAAAAGTPLAAGPDPLAALRGAPLCGLVGDQQGAALGHRLGPGAAKSTYGTGCFLIVSTGPRVVYSRRGLLTTPLARLGPLEDKTVQTHWALEGSVAVAGSGVTWLRDGLKLVATAAETETVAAAVADDDADLAGLTLVPAFAGLLAPHWREDARGVLVGLTHRTGRAHIVRALLESVAAGCAEVLGAAAADCRAAGVAGVLGGGEGSTAGLHVDGGMSANTLLMRRQADWAGCNVVRPRGSGEATARGAALAAAVGCGLATAASLHGGDAAGDAEELEVFRPAWSDAQRAAGLVRWRDAVARSLRLCPASLVAADGAVPANCSRCRNRSSPLSGWAGICAALATGLALGVTATAVWGGRRRAM